MKLNALSMLAAVTLVGCASEQAAHKPGHSDHPSGHAHAHRFDNAEEWAKKFDDPSRDAWQKPDDVIRALRFSPESVVADIGAGTGYFTMRIAPHVARVIALDVEPDMVRYVEERAKSAGLTNVVARVVPPDDPVIGEPVSDVIIVNTIHHIENRVAYFTKLRERSPRRVIVVDFKMGDIPVGPAESMRVTPVKLTDEMKRAGFDIIDVDESTLPHQYIAIYGDPAVLRADE